MKEKDLRQGTLYEYRYGYKAKRSSALFLGTLCLILIAALCFRMYWTGTFGGVYVDGMSMYPTLQTGDELLMKYGNDAERGDVIVVDVRGYGFESGTRFLIKRLIATEGDTVYCKDGQVFIRYAGAENFVELEEPYAYSAHSYDFGPYEVGDNEIFFLGDNRTNSMDSRYKENLSHLDDSLYTVDDIYGVVPAWSIRFKSVLRWLPGMNPKA